MQQCCPFSVLVINCLQIQEVLPASTAMYNVNDVQSRTDESLSPLIASPSNNRQQETEEPRTKFSLGETPSGATAAPENDSPLGDPFATRKLFWQNWVMAVFMGLLVGSFSFCFLSAVERSTETWYGSNEDSSTYNGFPNNALGYDVSGFGQGRIWWLAVTTAGGLLVGLFKLVTHFPQGETASFFQEIKEMHVHPRNGLRVGGAGFLSLCSGASLGPEAPIGALGGAFGTWLGHRLGASFEQVEVYTLLGMASALGALFSSPVLAVILLLEIAPIHRSRYLEVGCLTYTAAAISFCAYYGMSTNSHTFLKPNLGPPVAGMYTMGWTLLYMIVAVPLGILAAIVGILLMMVRAISGKLVLRVQQAFGCVPRSPAALLITPMIGGLLLGAIYVFTPLAIGDGRVALGAIMNDGYANHWKTVKGNTPASALAMFQQMYVTAQEDGWPNPSSSDRIYGIPLLIATAFMKALAFGISASTGFVGGFMFPSFFIGTAVGNIIAQLTGLNQSFACLAMLAAIPSSFSPLPLLFITLVVFGWACSAYQSAAIFVAMVTANWCVSGSGVFLRMQRKVAMPEWRDVPPSIRNPLSGNSTKSSDQEETY